MLVAHLQKNNVFELNLQVTSFLLSDACFNHCKLSTCCSFLAHFQLSMLSISCQFCLLLLNLTDISFACTDCRWSIELWCLCCLIDNTTSSSPSDVMTRTITVCQHQHYKMLLITFIYHLFHYSNTHKHQE